MLSQKPPLVVAKDGGLVQVGRQKVWNLVVCPKKRHAVVREADFLLPGLVPLHAPVQHPGLRDHPFPEFFEDERLARAAVLGEKGFVRRQRFPKPGVNVQAFHGGLGVLGAIAHRRPRVLALFVPKSML